ncbi:MAG: VOC family protein [Bauldia sp.]|nr:VOC family protein [Bauldia sp.]
MFRSRRRLSCLTANRQEDPMDWKLELVAVPVSDVDRAKAFYTGILGFNADHDHVVNDDIRFVQLTPPGSACSIALGKGITSAAPGSVEGLQLVVADIEAARSELAQRGLDVGEIKDFPWGRFIYLSDPDGNRWAVQELPERA